MTIDLKALRKTAAREIRQNASWLCPPQTVIALLDRLEAAEKDAARYRWLLNIMRSGTYVCQAQSDVATSTQPSMPQQMQTIPLAALAEPAVEPQQTGKEYVDRLEAAEKDAARYRWMTANYKLWSWQPTRYNAAITSGFAFNDTGYSGYSFEDALTLAMKDE